MSDYIVSINWPDLVIVPASSIISINYNGIWTINCMDSSLIALDNIEIVQDLSIAVRMLNVSLEEDFDL